MGQTFLKRFLENTPYPNENDEYYYFILFNPILNLLKNE